MNLSSTDRDEPEINLTSLIDVVLLLLVFFMITTSFVKESQIAIRLPESGS
ncbi:MAG: biopolymer transporter ExbD, partial [Gammaproteobacteria bacterium]